ncbi:nicotinate phosphoribosyltransferase [Salipaludibacillus sp. LMS25]|jgi:nicotinate phosphoribosyltransferase|uniref:nicotinate phosphoribosyltransferase n=1 Tax=Salipaludibacillus sp. LMS25 TaxID=2924031 RepID=UPI0020D1174C|nr:nicotinate phosphoribosyltransferase [Salipaludibacillus sp. LMS25]UTR13396.1 nicotinate phosphoribosyltransferase [Salipaludibacillus sp. LMS25]
MVELRLKEEGKLKRLTNKTFKFDERVGEGWYSAVYFLKTRKIAEKYKKNTVVTMQFFQKENAVLCGVDEVIALIETFADKPEELKIKALHDGDKITPFESVLTIEGHYHTFGHLEGVIDGILARRTSIATNVYKVVTEARDKKVIFMGDRDDHFSNQVGDGYAAYIGGMTAQATHAMNEWWGEKGLGTMPHAMIQMFGGDLEKACKAYVETFPEDDLIALVDYNNDVIGDALKVGKAFGRRLKGVRVDTSKQMIDQYFIRNNEELGLFDPRGVNPTLIKALRKALDNEGLDYVEIVVSGGFTVEKIRKFEQENTPVDVYGVGGSLLKVSIGFTGDNVLLDGNEEAKKGRRFNDNQRLEEVSLVKRRNSPRDVEA